jgi:hypothetical protein
MRPHRPATAQGRPTSARAAILTLLALLGLSACKRSETATEKAPVDPLAAMLGSYVRAELTLTVLPDGLSLHDGPTLPFSEGIRAYGERAKFEDAVAAKGFLSDDECSGTITPTDEGVVIAIEGDDICAIFGGTWRFDSERRLKDARERLRALEFRRAREALDVPLHPRDKAGRAAVEALKAEPEMVKGLAWEQAAAGPVEGALTAAAELIALKGPAAEPVRDWLVSKALDACGAVAATDRCFAVMAAALAAPPTPSQLERLSSHAGAVAATWLKEATGREYRGKTEEASALYEAVCRIAKTSEACATASTRWGRLRLRAGQREYLQARYGKARTELEAAQTASDELVRKEARRLLESPQLVAGCAFEEAQAKVAAAGPSDALVAELAAVCVKGPQSQSCLKARVLSGDVQLELAKREVVAGTYAEAERRLTAIVALGGNASFKARAMMRDAAFTTGREDEASRVRAVAVIAQCDAKAPDCEALAAAALVALGASPHADRVRQSVAAFQRARADAVIASCTAHKPDCVLVAEEALKSLGATPHADRIRDSLSDYRTAGAIERCEANEDDCEVVAQEALKHLGDTVQAGRVRQSLSTYKAAVAGLASALEQVRAVEARCGVLNDAERYASACFPPEASPDYAGAPVTPSALERLGAGLAVTFFGDALSTWTVAFALILACAWLGLALGVLLGQAKRGQLGRGLAWAAGLLGLLLAILLLRGGFEAADEVFRRSGVTGGLEADRPPS